MSHTLRLLLPILAICALGQPAWADEFVLSQHAVIVQILRDALEQDPSVRRDAVSAMQVDDARSPHCRKLEPTMARDHGARLVYKDLPIMGPTNVSKAPLAARASGRDCSGAPNVRDTVEPEKAL